jgi:hypothetical protein
MTSKPKRTLEQARLELRVAELELENAQLKQTLAEDSLHLIKLEDEATIRNKAVESLANEVERLGKSLKAATEKANTLRAERDAAWKKLNEIRNISAGYGRAPTDQFGYDPRTGQWPITFAPATWCGTGTAPAATGTFTVNNTVSNVVSKDTAAALKKIQEISKDLGKKYGL